MVFANTLDVTITVKFLALKKWVGEGANTGTPGRLRLCSFLATPLATHLATRAPEHDLKNSWQQSAIWYSFTEFISQAWDNEFLTWNINDYGGLDRIHFAPDEIWVPDIALCNKWVLVAFVFTGNEENCYQF